MKCPKCGADNPPKNNFCGKCGSNLQKIAEKDRIDIVKKDIPESLVKKILLTKDTIAKERKDVTVIFADISGFTSMSESLDPEELTLLMNDCFRKLSAMVYRYEGIIDKFIGDCIMAIFGAPVTHEDDPERAVLACLDMQLALNDVNKNLEKSIKKLAIHSGINTGQVIAGKVGSDLQMDYTVMGDTVNVAQRLKDIAPRGSILVGPETHNRTRHAFDFMTAEPAQLKGKTEMVKPYEVIGRKWGAEFGLSAVHSDLVGRDKEFSKLKKGYDDLINNKSSIHIIKGEIGVGKSRLLYEFKKFLSISASDIALIDGRGISYESSNPLKSFADALRRFVLSSESLSTDASEKLIKERIESILGSETDEIAPYLFKLLNITLDENQNEKIRHLDSHSLQLQIFLAVATLLENITKEKPVLFIMDDIQWADATSLELINFLLPIVKKNNIAFYLSYRIGNIATIKGLLSTVSKEFNDYSVAVDLKNLATEDSSRLINNLIGEEIGKKLESYIIAKSGGNPFFIEEIVRRIVESGMLARKEEITDEKIQIPGSIEAAVTSRIDSLNKEAKHLLKTASIIGRSFPKELLEEVIKEKEVYQHIDELETSEFLVKIVKDNTVHYAFRHALFQEVTYNSLLKSERIIYHKVIAETVESKFKGKIDGYFAILAHHFHNCKNLKKAFEYSVKAGDEAAALYANEEALSYYNQALSAVEDESAKVTILGKLGEIELLVGKMDEASKHFHEAKELARDEFVRADIIEKISRILEIIGKIDESIEMMEKAIKVIEGSDTPALISLYYRLSNVLIESRAESKRALTLVDKGLEIAKKIGNEKLEAEGLRAKGHILWRLGKQEEALTILKESRRIYEKLKDVSVLPYLFLLIAAVHRAVGDVSVAIEYAKKVTDIAQKIGNKRVLAMAYNNLGAYYAFLGKYRDSIDFTEKNVVIRHQQGDKKGEAIGLMNIGVAYKYLGELEHVLDYYNKAKDLFESINDVRGIVRVYELLGDIFITTGKKESALEYYEKALETAQATGDKALVGDSEYLCGDYFLELGDFEKAKEFFEQAEPKLIESADKYRLAELYLGMADIYIKENDTKALQYAEKGLKVAVETKVKLHEIAGLRTLGRAQSLVENNLTEGTRNIKRAIAIAKEIDAKEELAHSLSALGEVLITDNKQTQALEYLNRAKKIYSQMNAQWWLEDTDNMIKSIT